MPLPPPLSLRRGKAVTLSRDGGETWGPLTFQPQLRGPVCQASLATTAAAGAAGAVLFSGPNSTAERASLVVRKSVDGGATWDHALSIDPGPAGYSCLVAPLAQGCGDAAACGGVLYEAEGLVIRFARFPLGF